MKKACLLMIIILFCSKGFTQETTTEKKWLTGSVMEDYQVLKTDKQTKQGLYEALFHRKTPIAMGRYTNNKKTGTWRFYDAQGRLIQLFDYDNNRLLYEEPVNDTSRLFIRYAFDAKFKKTDVVTKPIIIGGRCYGFIPYLQLYHLSGDLDDIEPHSFNCVLEVLISPLGNLADIKIHLNSWDFKRTTTFSPDIIDKDDKQFIPATLNGEPIMARIFLFCRLDDDGSLDIE